MFALTILLKQSAADKAMAVSKTSSKLPNVLILVACRDEELMIADLCHSLSLLDYPCAKRRVVLIDDGSCDNTGSAMEQCAQGKSGWSVLRLESNLGKASALNAALEKSSFGEIVYVLDADHRPTPSALNDLVGYFDNPQVAGVSGRTISSNPLASTSAFYSTVETLIHQMVTMRAKDRLNLAPALLGSNCAYRRDRLAECGGFRSGALLEDSDLTLAFYRSGYAVRFAEDSVSYHQVPETVQGYLNQHTRWARGFADVATTHSMALLRDARLRLPLRIELFLFATGYLDRIALMGAMALTFLSILFPTLVNFPVAIVFFALLTPMFQIIILFIEQRMPLELWLRLPLVPIFYGLDIFAALRALVDSMLRRTRVWTKTTRVDSRVRQDQSRIDLIK